MKSLNTRPIAVREEVRTEHELNNMVKAPDAHGQIMEKCSRMGAGTATFPLQKGFQIQRARRRLDAKRDEAGIDDGVYVRCEAY